MNLEIRIELLIINIRLCAYFIFCKGTCMVTDGYFIRLQILILKFVFSEVPCFGLFPSCQFSIFIFRNFRILDFGNFFVVDHSIAAKVFEYSDIKDVDVLKF